jgi:hypothetical protein
MQKQKEFTNIDLLQSLAKDSIINSPSSQKLDSQKGGGGSQNSSTVEDFRLLGRLGKSNMRSIEILIC